MPPGTLCSRWPSQAPQALPLAVPLLQEVASAWPAPAQAALLGQRYAQTPSLDLLEALVQAVRPHQRCQPA